MLPGYAPAYEALSWGYWSSCVFEHSLEAINKAIQLSPNEARYYDLKAHVLLHANKPENEVLEVIAETTRKGVPPDIIEKYASNKMKDFLKKDNVIDAVAPDVSASVTYGIFNDDIVIYNKSPYPLTNLQVKIKIKGKDDNFKEKNDKHNESASISKLNPHEKHTLSNVFSIKGDAKIDIKLIYICDQSPVKWSWSTDNPDKTRYDQSSSETTW